MRRRSGTGLQIGRHRGIAASPVWVFALVPPRHAAGDPRRVEGRRPGRPPAARPGGRLERRPAEHPRGRGEAQQASHHVGSRRHASMTARAPSQLLGVEPVRLCVLDRPSHLRRRSRAVERVEHVRDRQRVQHREDDRLGAIVESAVRVGVAADDRAPALAPARRVLGGAGWTRPRRGTRRAGVPRTVPRAGRRRREAPRPGRPGPRAPRTRSRACAAGRRRRRGRSARRRPQRRAPVPAPRPPS